MDQALLNNFSIIKSLSKNKNYGLLLAENGKSKLLCMIKVCYSEEYIKYLKNEIYILQHLNCKDKHEAIARMVSYRVEETKQ
jgi:hypothetical protein